MNLGGAHGDIIRSLAALPENKRCMDCDAPNVTRVCTSLHTFVCANCATVLSQLGFVTKPLGRTGRAAFTRADVVGCLAEGNKKAREKWHGNDAGQLEIPDASDLELVAKDIRLRYIEKRWLREEPKTRRAPSPPKSPPRSPSPAKTSGTTTPVRQTRASLTPRSAAASPTAGKVPLYDRYAVEESRYGLPPGSPRSPPTPKLTNKKLF